MKVLVQRLNRPIDSASLGAFRILFGIAMMVEMIDHLASGRIAEEYILPAVHFHYPLLAWLQPLPEIGMYAVFVALFIAAFAITLGYRYRLASILFIVGYAYIFFIDQTQFRNHYYLILLFSLLMICVGAERSFSLDQLRRKKPEWIPSWHLWILLFQIGVVHVFAALAKVNADWFRGEPIRFWFPELSEGSVYFIVYGGFFYNLLIVPALLWKKTRYAALMAAFLFHFLNSQMFGIGIFPWLMAAAMPLFLDPSWPRTLFCLKRRPSNPLPSFDLAPMTTALLAAFALIQIALPLRHFLYPGPVSWTEEGRTFAWQMKLRDKQSELTLHGKLRGSDHSFVINAHQYLSDFQISRMNERPDLIAQFSRTVAQEYHKHHGKPIAIYADSSVSLNVRPAQPMINSTVDLAVLPKGVRAREWIVELEE